MTSCVGLLSVLIKVYYNFHNIKSELVNSIVLTQIASLKKYIYIWHSFLYLLCKNIKINIISIAKITLFVQIEVIICPSILSIEHP